MPHEHILFVTGRLAEKSLRAVVERLATEVDFTYSIDVLPITIAAFMTPGWIADHISMQPGRNIHRIILPGYCLGDLAPILDVAHVPVERGPRDLRQLPSFFHRQAREESFGQYAIEIFAEINHCPRLSLDDILAAARELAADGADVIDVGCEPGGPWLGIADAVRALRDAGYRVSIDSLDRTEIQLAVAAGVEIVLSVNRSNCDAAADWGTEVVAIPDFPATLDGLEETIRILDSAAVPFRIDPVLEPIGFGFAASLGRYLHVRQRYPDAAMLMGIGNLTELTDVDSAGINVLLLGICQELDIRSVLTTQVINWARTSVRECDLARRLVHYAVSERILPKHVEPRLVVLRDTEIAEYSAEELDELAGNIRDRNHRIFASGGTLHIIRAGMHLEDRDPFQLFKALVESEQGGQPPPNFDLEHAFYLGYELCKAKIAQKLGKQYNQDESLDWGYLTNGRFFNNGNSISTRGTARG
ncbi:MAG: dihydropteroate synthase [Pirellulales bacterium]|nr:dihydropteroate synthase [Pirellulales bacterium]